MSEWVYWILDCLLLQVKIGERKLLEEELGQSTGLF
jgi:hypothetical protein